MKPLAVDLYCGVGGWAEGLLAYGYDVVGFDIERHEYGEHRYPGWLVIQDVLTLHGSQFKDAALIVASPPCQEPSYRAMPWSKAKALNEAGPPHKFIELFNACFRIQREACEAAGRHVPLIVENVRGAQPWVGSARWNWGSFYLWGDVPALMPTTIGRKNNGGSWFAIGGPDQKATGQNPDGRNPEARPGHPAEGYKSSGMNWSDRTIRGQDFTRIAGNQAIKGNGGTWFHEYRPGQGTRNYGSNSNARKAASAMIAKIPAPLSRHIAAVFHPAPPHVSAPHPD